MVLKVHGITPAGSELQQDLVQVLQNRLDDAVLEFLSIMLARNAMCPLTPEDVRFIQKPQQKPDYVFRVSLMSMYVFIIYVCLVFFTAEHSEYRSKLAQNKLIYSLFKS